MSYEPHRHRYLPELLLDLGDARGAAHQHHLVDAVARHL